MNPSTLLADLVVLCHLAYVLFVILAIPLILLGGLRNWDWVRNPWFRLIHLGMMAVVVVESLLSITCPLTTLEDYLRRRGGQSAPEGSFVGRLAHDLLFIDLPQDYFAPIYCGVGALIASTFLFVPIRSQRKKSP